MSDSEVEETLLELESEILTLKLDDVLKLANDMKLEKSSVEDKSRFFILNFIRKSIEEKVGSLTEKVGIVEYIDSIKEFLGPPPLEENSEEPEIEEKSPEEKQVLELQEEIEKLLSKQKEIQSKLGGAKKNNNKGTGVNTINKSSVHLDDVLKVPLVSLEKSVLHRDFKIQGVIGEPGQKDKLRSFWEDEVHIVLLRKGPDSPVYDVTSESKTKKPRTLHRNMLLPCDYLSCESAVPIVSREQRRQERPSTRNTSIDDSPSDDEDEFPSVSRRVQLQPADNIADIDDEIPDIGQLAESVNSDGDVSVTGNEFVEQQEIETGEIQEEMEEHVEIPIPEDVPEPNIEEETWNNLPPRNRQVPQRLTYYAPGHSSCYYCGAVIIPFNHQIHQFPYHQPEPQPYQIPIPWTYNYPAFPIPG